MDELKAKIMSLLHKLPDSQFRVPAMGFSDYFIETVTKAEHTKLGFDDSDEKYSKKHVYIVDNDETNNSINSKKSDQEVIENIHGIYFQADSNTSSYELQKVLVNGINCDFINTSKTELRKQLKVLSKLVLQNILDQRNSCNTVFIVINRIQKELEEALWTCRKARSYLNYSRMNLTRSSLEILASYRKRGILVDLLYTLNAIRKLKTTDIQVEKLLSECNYSEAISTLVDCKNSATEFMQYNCVQSLHKKLEDTLLLTEFQLDSVLNEMIFNFDMQKYSKLQEAYKLLNKSLLAMDKLHINYISTIHSSVNRVIRSFSDPNMDDNVKYLYEQLCKQIEVEKYIPCLITLCKTIWTILASYYQIVTWHQDHNLYPLDYLNSPDIYIKEKLQKGQLRIWNDVMSKICTYLQSSKMTILKYDSFIQVLSIVERLKKVGIEFCGEQSQKLIEIMQSQSEAFFQRYHIACLEEICLYLDNELWTRVDAFTHVMQLPEFRFIQRTLKQHNISPLSTPTLKYISNSPVGNDNCDELVSVHSQDAGSSTYDSCIYFFRFEEKSSPFDGGFDITMLEEDILSGIIVDETSCYFSEESDDEQKNMQNKDCDNDSSKLEIRIINNTALNILRCVGRYLQMYKLLYCISPKIVGRLLQLFDFYLYAVHNIFTKNMILQIDTFNSVRLNEKLKQVAQYIASNVNISSLNFSFNVNIELSNPDTLFGLEQRIVAVESCNCLIQQFQLLHSYLNMSVQEKDIFCTQYGNLIIEIARQIYLCVTSRYFDIPAILSMMTKVKWDISHVSFQHSNYIDIMNRNVQNFAMHLEDITKDINIPLEQVWSSMAYIAAYILIEGFSNVKKCSPGGRALMQLDFTNFISMLELISNQKFPEMRTNVDEFIKAYYYSYEQLENWILRVRNMEPPRYSLKQLTNIIGCLYMGDKRNKQKLLNLLDINNYMSVNS